jgi:Ca2+-binding RTX toxin-like protein
MADINGTEGNDVLSGTDGDDHLRGLGGDDYLTGALGNDLLEGGDGSDNLRSDTGSDTLRGEAGDDALDFFTSESPASTVILDGGVGDDYIRVVSWGTHAFQVSGGDGADRIAIEALAEGGSATVSLGAGSDIVTISDFYSYSIGAPLVFTDFQTGAGGDQLDWLGLLSDALIGWDGASNPFGAFARLVQSGSDSVLQIDCDGTAGTYGFVTLATFSNTLVSDFVWQNLDGFPTDGTIPSNVVITGTEGRDFLYGSAGADLIDGLGGWDEIHGGIGDDVIHGGDSLDYLYGENGADRIEGGAGNDLIDGGKGADQLYGGDGDDYVTDTDGADFLYGEDGNDYLDLRRGSLHADLVTADGGTGDDSIRIHSLGASRFVADGGVGNDTFLISALNDLATLTLGAGVDKIVLQGDYAGYLMTSGEIVVTDFTAGAGGDMVDISNFFPYSDGGNPFGNGSLTLVQDGANALLQINSHTMIRFDNVAASALTAENFGGYAPDGSPPPGVTFSGTEGYDDFAGGPGADTIDGLGGGDMLYGRAGADVIHGGAGNDILFGEGGDDIIDGGDGDDRVWDGAGNDTVLLGAGNDQITTESGFDSIDAGAGDDEIVIEQSSGSVTLAAGDGNDDITLAQYFGVAVAADGGAGDDVFHLLGGFGVTSIRLGAGADLVAFDSVQYGWLAMGGQFVVADYDYAAGDRLRFTTFFANELQGWDGVTNPFAAGYLRLVQSGADTRIEFDDDLGGQHDFLLLAKLSGIGANTLTAADFGFAPGPVFGSSGNDVFIVDEASDQIVDSAGIDEVRTSLASYVLPAGFEKLTGTSASGQDLRGNALDNVLTGGGANDFIRAQDGGNDSVNLGAGNDAVYFGSAYTSADSVDGGSGSDQVALQGDYSGGVTLGALTGVETLVAMTHSDVRFGGGSASPFSYNIVAPDSTVAAGTQLLVNASTLQAGENLTFDGSAETNGSFFIYGGKGVDTLTGGSGADVFFFAEDGRFAATDHIDGGAGADVMVLRGNYSLVLSGTSLVNVETVVLNSGSDARFYAAGTPFSYDIATADDTVAAGQTMTFNGGQLGASETLHFDGSAETNGNFRLFGGSASDVIKGGAGNDLIYGGLGGDVLSGGAGADVFWLKSAAESSSTHYDTLIGFDQSVDRIDLPTAVSSVAYNGMVGTINQATFDADIARIVDQDLNPYGAIMVTTDNQSDIGGHVFLIVDGDGDGAYQADHDYVFDVTHSLIDPTPAMFI